MYPDPIPAAAADFLDRQERLIETTEQAHRRLFVEMADALAEDPMRNISAPGYRYSTDWTPARIVADDMTEGMAADLLRIVALAAMSADHALRLPAQAFMAAVALRHADYHCDELEVDK